MISLIKKIFGTPPKHKEEKEEHEVVETPEFDLTQYAKKLGLAIGVLVPAIAGGLKAFKDVPTAVIVGALGVTAAALLGIAFVSAVDIAARAFLNGEGSAQKKDPQNGDDDGKSKPAEPIPAPQGMQIWLKEGGGPYPVIAIDSGGEKYLVATGSVHDREVDGKEVKAVDGTIKWCGGDEVQAIRSDKWP